MYYIYLILNKVNGKTYVGQRKSSKEWNNDSYMGSGKLLKLAKKKHGIENFEKFLIQYCYSKEETDKAEKFWITEYRNRGKAEYNIADGGQGYYAIGENHPMYGKHHSEESKARCRESVLKTFEINNTRQKLSEMRRGIPKSEEHKVAISNALRGKPLSEEHRQHCREAQQKYFETHEGTFKGKHHSEESKEKNRLAHLGKPSWNKGLKLGTNGTHWYNNGKINVKAKECPDGFVKGRLNAWQNKTEIE